PFGFLAGRRIASGHASLGASKPSSYWVTLALLGRRRATERDEVSLVGDTAVLGQPAAAPRLTGSAQRFTGSVQARLAVTRSIPQDQESAGASCSDAPRLRGASWRSRKF